MRITWLALLAACGGARAPQEDPGKGSGSASGTAVVAGPCDVSTEDKAAELFSELTGKPVVLDDDRCVQLSSTFVGWVQLGWFADDRGCEYDTFAYECKLVDHGSPGRAMAAAGWNDADAARRQELLVAYLAEILHTNLVTNDTDNEFPTYKQTFTAPTFDGSAITFWESDAGGMSPEVTYTHMKMAVNADGTLGGAEQLAQFTTVYE